MRNDTDFDVIIVGAAIAGATLMNILADRGLSVLVLDKEQGVLEIPRAAHIDDEVLRYFQQFNMAVELAESLTPRGRFDFYNYDGHCFLSFPECSERDQGTKDGFYFFQPDFEHFLRDRATSKGVRLLERHEVTRIEQNQEAVTVTYRNLDDPHTGDVQATAKYMVACDGSSSFTRKALGVKMEKLAEGSSHIIIDFTLKDGVEVPEDLGFNVWARCGENGTTIYVHMPKEIKRLEFDVPDGADHREFESDDNVFSLIAPWVKRDDVKDILRANVYTYHSLVANSWLEGRVLLAGDAAHLTPPFLGQGACAAVRDVFNLGWKLVRVIRGQSDPALLKTYQTERRVHAAELVERAGKVGEMFKQISKMSIEEISAMEPQELSIHRPILGPGLHGDAPVPAGTLGPQPRLADGTPMDQIVGPNFGIVGDPDVIDGISAQTKATFEKLGGLMVRDTGEGVKHAIAQIGGKVMVTRPDHYLLGVANTPEEIDEIVKTAADYILENVSVN